MLVTKIDHTNFGGIPGLGPEFLWVQFDNKELSEKVTTLYCKRPLYDTPKWVLVEIWGQPRNYIPAWQSLSIDEGVRCGHGLSQQTTPWPKSAGQSALQKQGIVNNKQATG